MNKNKDAAKLGSNGGKALLKKRGPAYFKKLAKLRWKNKKNGHKKNG